MNKLKIIGVMGSGNDEHLEFSEPLGKWIAESGFHLLTGGGGSGVMQVVSKTFVETKKRSGLSLGVIPGKVENRKYKSHSGYPNPWIEVPLYTHLPFSGKKGTDPLSRNHINILSADYIVVLPGSYGTISEVELALQYNKPAVGFYKNFLLLTKMNIKIPHFNKLEEVSDYILKRIKI
ncbi:MAG: molybdenum cofactor carrier protein [Calditrichaeota bacterium]|nr:MAG: molybdenum cofactor carrier protein [Calditrichota bacterium]MBL1203888.1 molybdenum cofactor carrier protein [Calditrichota bacterium]NOG43720.1 LOG family protein [Calditrichota bacterium]